MTGPMRGKQSKQRSPISTQGWTFENVLSYGTNFRSIERVSATSSDTDIQQAIKRYEDEGIPIIIEGWQNHDKWPKGLFELDSFQKHSCKGTYTTFKTPTSLLRNSYHIAEKSLPCVSEGEQLRMYGKDAECPPPWRRYFDTEGLLPPSLLSNGPNDYFRYRPKDALVETLMCYLGVGDTFTAAHKDLCGSSGHNLMCYTEQDGSDAPDVADYFRKLGHELDHETHVLSLEEMKKAPFDLFVGKQVLGDLVLVPPRSCHQVVNYGGITLKTSWSRMSLYGLRTALYHELPLYQRVCRFETYRIKSTIYYAIQKQSNDLNAILTRVDAKEGDPASIIEADERTRALEVLYELFTHILSDEYSPVWKSIVRLDLTDDDHADVSHGIYCDFCGSDIFQSFLECNKCFLPDSGGHGTYTICPRCYIEGRTCNCGSMDSKQVQTFHKLLDVQSKAYKVLKMRNVNVTHFSLGPEHNSIFAAAHCLRTTAKIAPRICNIDKCFEHLLTVYNLHAADALIAWIHSDKDHHKYHKVHSNAKASYMEHRDQNRRVTSVTPFFRTHIALKHSTCRPVIYSLSKPGFYDRKIQDCDERVAGGDDFEPEGRPEPEDEPFNALTPAEMAPQAPSASASVALPRGGCSSPDPGSSGRSKGTAPSRRLVMDYVEIPYYPIARPTRNITLAKQTLESIASTTSDIASIKVGPPKSTRRERQSTNADACGPSGSTRGAGKHLRKAMHSGGATLPNGGSPGATKGLALPADAGRKGKGKQRSERRNRAPSPPEASLSGEEFTSDLAAALTRAAQIDEGDSEEDTYNLPPSEEISPLWQKRRHLSPPKRGSSSRSCSPVSPEDGSSLRPASPRIPTAKKAKNAPAVDRNGPPMQSTRQYPIHPEVLQHTVRNSSRNSSAPNQMEPLVLSSKAHLTPDRLSDMAVDYTMRLGVKSEDLEEGSEGKYLPAVPPLPRRGDNRFSASSNQNRANDSPTRGELQEPVKIGPPPRKSASRAGASGSTVAYTGTSHSPKHARKLVVFGYNNRKASSSSKAQNSGPPTPTGLITSAQGHHDPKITPSRPHQSPTQTPTSLGPRVQGSPQAFEQQLLVDNGSRNSSPLLHPTPSSEQGGPRDVSTSDQAQPLSPVHLPFFENNVPIQPVQSPRALYGLKPWSFEDNPGPITFITDDLNDAAEFSPPGLSLVTSRSSPK
ncbi:hypothetical protein DFP72DRAFT_873813 [Ephemerocybe angulata]|uniref:JmjC domain-containing protein n=1 Tax=Ephemerocybe angulata TaxID=980116 RepID=A0A8H6MFX7_9AGAR|nr:hypothetical protein DFP72DRAFT_873813 [Tulosesus angulatus]